MINYIRATIEEAQIRTWLVVRQTNAVERDERLVDCDPPA